MIFVSIQLTDDDKIETVGYRVDQMFPDGSGHVLNVDLFEDDISNVIKEIKKILIWKLINYKFKILLTSDWCSVLDNELNSKNTFFDCLA